MPGALDVYERFVARIAGERVTGGDVRMFCPPKRPLPEFTLRRITWRDESWTAIDMNLRPYGMPASMADSVLDTNACFSGPEGEFGDVAMADGVAVSAATAIELRGGLHATLVATGPEHRQKGYAEAVVRHALGDEARCECDGWPTLSADGL